MGPPPPALLQGALGMLHQAAAARPTTDAIMSGLWIVVIILAPILAFALLFMILLGGLAMGFLLPLAGLGFFGILAIAIMIPAVLYVIFFYKLLNRMSAHFAREAQVRRALIDYLRARAALDGREPWIAAEVATMEAINADSNGKDRPQSGALAILMLIPVVRWVVLYWVHKWPADHDQRWLAFSQQAAGACAKLGIPVVVASWNPVAKRSFALYLILSLIIPFFSIYWYYTFIKDPNDHFNTHAAVEGAFVASVR